MQGVRVELTQNSTSDGSRRVAIIKKISRRSFVDDRATAVKLQSVHQEEETVDSYAVDRCDTASCALLCMEFQRTKRSSSWGLSDASATEASRSQAKSNC